MSLLALLATPLLLVTGYVGTGSPTASGAWPVAGVTAACPPQLALGQHVVIDGLGERVCQDKYALYLGPRIDCYVDSIEEAYALTGLRHVEVVGAS